MHHTRKGATVALLVAAFTLATVFATVSGVEANSGGRYGSGNSCTIYVFGTDASPQPYSYTRDVYASCYQLGSRTESFIAPNTFVWGSSQYGINSIQYSYGSFNAAWVNSVGSSDTIGWAYPVYVF
jgi:hypothetical protein